MSVDPTEDALARRYRWLLLAYPPRWRAARGDEILGTLLEAASPGQRRPTAADVTDLLAGAARARLSTLRTDGLADGAAIAAPIALALAAGLSVALWAIVEPSAPATTAPLAYAAWLLAAGGWTVLGPARGRFAVLGALVATCLAVPAAALTSSHRPPLWTLLTLVALGVLGLGGAGVRVSTRERLTVPLGALAAVGVFAALLHEHRPDGYYQPVIAVAGATVALAVAGSVAVAIRRAVRRQPALPWLWASLLLALPGGWLGPLSPRIWRFGLDGWSAPHFGRLADVLLATVAVWAVAAWLRGATRRDGDTLGAASVRLGRAGGVAVGCAAGLSLALGPTGEGVVISGYGWGQRTLGPVVYAAWLLAALGWVFARPNAARQLTALATVATAAVPGIAGVTGAGDPPPWLLATLGLLGVVGTAAPPAPGRPAVTLLATVATALATAVVLAYDNGWTVQGWRDFPASAALAGTLALVPFALVAVAAAGLLRFGPPRVSAVVALVASAGWLGAATLPYLSSWGPVLLLLAVGGVTATVCWPLLRPTAPMHFQKLWLVDDQEVDFGFVAAPVDQVTMTQGGHEYQASLRPWAEDPNVVAFWLVRPIGPKSWAPPVPEADLRRITATSHGAPVVDHLFRPCPPPPQPRV